MSAIHWKSVDHTVIDTIPSRVQSYNRMSSIGPGNGKPNPLHHYRKQLCDNRGSRCNQQITHLIPYKDNGCKEDGSKFIKSGMTNARVKVDDNNNKTTKINNYYSYSSKELLRKNCSLYTQRLPGTLISGTDYTSPPSSDPNGSQIVNTRNCSNSTCTTIYKPNNKQYGVQGSVDSSSRIHRLRHNTMRTNLNSLSKTYGINSANMVYGATPYILKSKSYVCEPGLYRRNGKKLVTE